MPGYIGTKAVLLSTTAANVTGNASITGDLTVDTNTLFVDSANNRVGVGTVSPAAALDVKGSTSDQIRLRTADTEHYALGRNASTGFLDFYGSQASYTGYTFGGVDGERMRIDASGNVGIGTSSPQAYTNLVTAGVGGSQGGVIDFHASAVGVGKNRVGQIYGGNGGFLSFATGASDGISERMRIDSSGNVGIGTSSPSNKLSLVDASGSCVLDMSGSNGSGSYGYATISTVLGSSGNGYGELTIGTSSAGTVTERMRIDSSGNLLVGKTSGGSILNDGAELSSNYSMFAASNTGTNPTMFVGANGSGGYLVTFYYGVNTVGAITTNGSSTSYNTSSDYRLKEDVQPMTGASDRVLALKPVNFAWKADGSRVDGFLAHEAQEVVPEAVTGAKDAMRDEEYEVTPAVYEDVIIPAVLDDDGNEIEPERTEQRLVSKAVMGTRQVPAYQGIDQSKLVPLLTAALQEALTEIAALKDRVAALEGN
jgi:hypothetical protein